MVPENISLGVSFSFPFFCENQKPFNGVFKEYLLGIFGHVCFSFFDKLGKAHCARAPVAV